MRQKKGILGLALLALLAFTITATVGATASASGGHAVAAKKKCKKKKHAASAKKKKKCKKKGGSGTTTPPATGSPLVRATLTWSAGGDSTDYDLYAFDGATSARAASNPIANTSFSGNVTGSTGTETFTDLIFMNPGARNFQFGVCKQGGGNDGSTYNIDYVTADGAHHTDTQSGHGDGYAAKYSGGAPIAPNGFTPCPAP
jgi:hypothetical protein